jgi:hypothetical protein
MEALHYRRPDILAFAPQTANTSERYLRRTAVAISLAADSESTSTRKRRLEFEDLGLGVASGDFKAAVL